MSTCKLADSQYNLRSKGKMNDKDEFNVATNIMIPIENLEGSRNVTDNQNEEKMADMEQELKNLMKELRQVRDLAKLSASTFPTFKMPIYFRKTNLSSSDLPNQPEQTQHAPTHGQVPPASPITVRTMSDLSNRDPTIPTIKIGRRTGTESSDRNEPVPDQNGMG
ncbi:hypothetical protein KY289_026745 [Solanum tuberosum]|nr:hypothetical protein KY289_026745 [Solanum tuberosum]